MTKITIISGFLGAGKTTLIKKLLEEVFKGEKIVLIENEFGEIGIDSGFLKDTGIEINEMNSGCICCSLVGDFGDALKEVLEKYKPERILIEPSGVGKLSDVINAVKGITDNMDNIELTASIAVADVSKCRLYMKNFGEFYNNQIEYADTIVLSRTKEIKEERLEMAIKILREKNLEASIITTPWEELTGEQIFAAMERVDSLKRFIDNNVDQNIYSNENGEECGCAKEHSNHSHEHGEECGCVKEHNSHSNENGEECGCAKEHSNHSHENDEECGCAKEHNSHSHEHGEECGCVKEHNSHSHENGEECGCNCGCGHGHHENHHADDVFTSWGKETPHKYTKEEIETALEVLSDTEDCGIILRAKGIVASVSGEWYYFDVVPGEIKIRIGNPDYTGRLCVIGSNLNIAEIEKLFHI
jgi:Putative GTPases (G3E family)